MTTKNNTFCSLSSLLTFLLCLVCQFGICDGQDSQSESEFTPESMGFSSRSLKTDDAIVNYHLSTGGRPLDKSAVRPLIMFLDGSGPSPIFWGKGKRIGSSLMFGPEDFPNYHYVVISKPGISFHEAERRIASEAYDRMMSLPWRVNAANAVINQLATEPFVDSSRVLVIGHSEGADVAPWVAVANKHVTHVAGLAPGGVSQMFDFVLFVRKKVEAGELTKEQGDTQIREIKNAYRAIFADPTATDKKWQGETHLRWSTFFRPAMDAWCQIKVPVFLGYCRDDKNTPVECGEAIELEFIRLGKQNLTAKLWVTDHHFQQVPEDQSLKPIDLRLEVLKEILAWAKKTSR